MTLRTHSIYGFIRLLLLSLMFPCGGLCGGREEVLANGWTLDLLIERFNHYQEKAITYDLEHPPSKNWGGGGTYFCGLLNMVEKLGDREALPFLEEKSFMTNAPSFIRERAAEVYVNIADVEESVLFLAKYCDDPTVKKGKWLLIQQYLDKLTPEVKNRLSSDALSRVHTVLLTIMQKTDVRDAANRINLYMLQAVPQYTNSVQRACLTRFATEGNEWVTNTFHPIKAHFDKIPPRQRIDLRKRFPGLPPLPDDAPARSPVKVAIAVVAGVVAVVAAWFVLRQRKVRKAV